MDSVVESTATHSSLEAQLEELLGEELASAVDRAQSTFDRLTAPVGEPLVLFGAGGLGRKTLAGLRSQGIEPLAFADNNPALWNKSVDDLPVFSPQEAARRFGDRAAFVVTIWRAGGGHRLAHTRQQLLGLGCRRVVSFAPLFWKYAETFLPYYCWDVPHRICEQAVEVRQAFELWSDEASRREYLAQLRWRLLLDFDGLPSPVAHEQYFPPDLFLLSPDEVFVDCGAFDGDTLKSFIGRQGENFKGFVALEPDPTNFRKLESYVSTLGTSLKSKITLSPLAVAARAGKLYFEATGTAAATASVNGTLEVTCAPLDEILADNRPTFVKMDIEGAEMDALIGARGSIKKTLPVLAICVYHQPDHLWRIPLLIWSFSDQYRFFLRPHNEEGWDLVCYAVPVNRLKVELSKKEEEL
jgi:FkbM family methyltransferase